MVNLKSRELLFPSVVSIYQLENFQHHNTVLRKVVHDSIEQSHAKVLSQTMGDLHVKPELSDFVNEIKNAVNDYLNFMKYQREGFEITNCWGNLYTHMDMLQRHSHPNNFISGSYYVSAPKGSGTITFFEPRPHASILDPAKHEHTLENSAAVSFPPIEGQLLLFPSWLEHQVDFNIGNEDRISIAFNIMLTGQYGEEGKFRSSKFK